MSGLLCCAAGDCWSEPDNAWCEPDAGGAGGVCGEVDGSVRPCSSAVVERAWVSAGAPLHRRVAWAAVVGWVEDSGCFDWGESADCGAYVWVGFGARLVGCRIAVGVCAGLLFASVPPAI